MVVLKWIGMFLFLAIIASTVIVFVVKSILHMLFGIALSSAISGIIALIVIIGGLIWYGKRRKRANAKNG